MNRGTLAVVCFVTILSLLSSAGNAGVETALLFNEARVVSTNQTVGMRARVRAEVLCTSDVLGVSLIHPDQITEDILAPQPAHPGYTLYTFETPYQSQIIVEANYPNGTYTIRTPGGSLGINLTHSAPILPIIDFPEPGGSVYVSGPTVDWSLPGGGSYPDGYIVKLHNLSTGASTFETLTNPGTTNYKIADGFLDIGDAAHVDIISFKGDPLAALYRGENRSANFVFFERPLATPTPTPPITVTPPTPTPTATPSGTPTTPSPTPSPTGTPPTPTPVELSADANGDGSVDLLDLLILLKEWHLSATPTP